jgi:ABC-type branched-subunit amino acid transport system permease subunit
MAAGAVLLGGAGTIVGAIVGAGKADTWQRVLPREGAQVGLVAPGAAGRLAFGASLRF